MNTDRKCKHCWKDIRKWVSLCEKCNDIRRNNLAMMTQNKIKLRTLIKEKKLTPEWLDKFILYANNIVKYWKIVMEYKEEDSIRTFNKIRKIWTIWFAILLLCIILV